MLHFENASLANDWLLMHGVNALQTDSRQVQVGDAFIAVRGAQQDGRAFVASALEQGAAVCLVEGLETQQASELWAKGLHIAPEAANKVAAVRNLKEQAAQIAANFYGHPSQELPLFAVTGTNGKTSSAFWLAQAFNALITKKPLEQAFAPCAVIGTLGVGLPNALHATGFTTPSPVALQGHLHDLLVAGVKACAIEASSIGIEQGRLDATKVRVAALTNFSQDHLDYHGSMQNYWQEKARLFAWEGLQAAVLNVDDEKGLELFSVLQESQEQAALDLWSVSLQGPARLHMHSVQDDDMGLSACVVEPAHNEVVRLQTGIHGSYNAYNLLTVLACMRAVGVSLVDAVQALQGITPVPGRMEVVTVTEIDSQMQTSSTSTSSASKCASLPLVLVDYAHTPDALQNALTAMHGLVQSRGGKLWCVFGCGGDRDASKRPLMGAIAEKYADQVLVTSDNPRHETPQSIVDGIVRGMSGTPKVVLDRHAAIAQAVQQAASNDIVLVAGKGHESYQEVAGIRQAFDDRQCARHFLQERLQVQLDKAVTLSAEQTSLGGVR